MFTAAQTISADVAEATQTLSSEWQAYGPTFNSVSENGASLQLMTDAFFALDKLVKDQKLAISSGDQERLLIYQLLHL